MADITVKGFDELDNSYQGAFLHAAKSLGVTSWGMNIERLPAGWADYPLPGHSSRATWRGSVPSRSARSPRAMRARRCS